MNPHILEGDSLGDCEKEHAPVFKEHFDDVTGLDQEGSAKRKSAAFMYQVSLQEIQPQPHPSSLPAFARKLPPNFSDGIDNVGPFFTLFS